MTALRTESDEVTVDVVNSGSEDLISEIDSVLNDDESSTAIEKVHFDEDFFYMEHVMRLAAALHSLVSLAMLIAYYHLKVI